MATIIKTNGEMLRVDPKNGKDFKLQELQEIVGGYIECVYINDKIQMVVNEEGKITGLPLNVAASSLAGQCIVGDVLVCERKQIK